MTTNHKTNKQNRKNNQRTDAERITAKTLAAVLVNRWVNDIQNGRTPWARPCYTLQALAISHDTGRPYSLTNQILLETETPTEYTTFLQAKKAGGHVKKGEKTRYINGFREIKIDLGKDQPENNQPEGEEPEQVSRRLLYPQGVFSLDQTEGVNPKWEKQPAPQPMTEAEKEAFFARARSNFRNSEDATNGMIIKALALHYWHDNGRPVKDDEGVERWPIEEGAIISELAAALVFKYIGIEPEPGPVNLESLGHYIGENFMRIYSVISISEKAARHILNIEEEPQPVKLPQPEKAEAEPEQEQPEPIQTTEPVKTPVFIATKNKACEPFPGETLPFKKIPAGALVKLTKAGLTRHDVEIFTGGLFYRAKVKNLLFMEESPAQVWPGLKPEKQPKPTEAEQEHAQPAPVVEVVTPAPVKSTPRPLRAVLLDDDDDDAEPLTVCTLAAL